MPWKEVSVMSQRKEFVTLAQRPDANIRQLCTRFGISPTTGYKWLERFDAQGDEGIKELSRRPHNCPFRTQPEVEHKVLALRDAHPAWGGRKLRARLLALGHTNVPSPSTITAILKRNGRIAVDEAAKHKPWQRFEHEAANQLWQMDFKGHFPIAHGRCHPLSVLDDHSRFAVGLYACADEKANTVQGHLTEVFRRYGLPQRMLMDNGAPWGSDADHPHTIFTVWLMRLGIRVSHGRPRHPQTQGKDERFHRSLMAEVVRGNSFSGLNDCQDAFGEWIYTYNFERPHEALGLLPPISRYQVSKRAFPETLPSIEYGDADLVRRVGDKGEVSFRGRLFKVGKAFRGYPVALRPTLTDGVWDVYFLIHKVSQLDLR